MEPTGAWDGVKEVERKEGRLKAKEDWKNLNLIKI